MIYFHFYTLYNIITIYMAVALPNYNPPSTMSGIMVYITLTMGITGYFTRYWAWKVKINMIDLMFASFLISAIGVASFIAAIVYARKTTRFKYKGLASYPIEK